MEEELTVDAEHDPLGDGGGNVVGCDAEIGAHLMTLHLADEQPIALEFGHCKRRRSFLAGAFSSLFRREK